MVYSASGKVSELPYYDCAAFTPNWLSANSLELARFHKISDFNFMDQQSKQVTQKTFKDKIYVASFFFTTCPGIYPKMRSQLSKVQDQFIDNDKVTNISYLIRPGNDTVDVLQAYAQDNEVVSGKWHLVTGKRKDITPSLESLTLLMKIWVSLLKSKTF